MKLIEKDDVICIIIKFRKVKDADGFFHFQVSAANRQPIKLPSGSPKNKLCNGPITENVGQSLLTDEHKRGRGTWLFLIWMVD